MSSYNQLTDSEEERVAIHLEESGESLQEIGKILRHGFDCWNPFDPDKVTNRTKLTKEVGDMWIATRLLIEGGDIDETVMLDHIRQKLVKMQRFIRDPNNLAIVQKIAKEIGVEQPDLPVEQQGVMLVNGKPFVLEPMV